MTKEQALEKMKHLKMILKSPSLSTLEDLQIDGGEFLGRDLPAIYKDLLPSWYVENLTKNKTLFNKAKEGAITRSDQLENYSKLIFFTWFDHYKTRVEAWDVLIKLIVLKDKDQ